MKSWITVIAVSLLVSGNVLMWHFQGKRVDQLESDLMLLRAEAKSQLTQSTNATRVLATFESRVSKLEAGNPISVEEITELRADIEQLRKLTEIYPIPPARTFLLGKKNP
ncbi:MAG: hypothetical protein AAF571_00765 [Verrucomicrobiota bacterium]